MFGLGKHGPDGRYGVIMDIGSGSVGLAIVASDPTQDKPEFIWTTRERMAVKDVTSSTGVKGITTTLVNAMLLLAGEGMKALLEHDKKAQIEELQVSISAPWSYTIAKTVTYKKDEDFEISKKLLSELVRTAQKQALELIDENDIVSKLGLKVITRATINVAANGYSSESVLGQSANTLAISHVSAITQDTILQAIDETHEKVTPKADLNRYTFMLIYYSVLKHLRPDTTEICLIDVTSEATEIGIVREGILKYVTHTDIGTYTLAREISSLSSIPHEEALGFIRGNFSILETLSEKKRVDFEAIIESYTEQISSLFKRTGDQLSIPRTIFLHTDSRSEQFFSESLKSAAQKATKIDHSIHLVTSKLLPKNSINDTALLLSAQFFHNQSEVLDFEQA